MSIFSGKNRVDTERIVVTPYTYPHFNERIRNTDTDSKWMSKYKIKSILNGYGYKYGVDNSRMRIRIQRQNE